MSCRVELIEESQDRQEKSYKIGDKFYYKRIPSLKVVIKDIFKPRNQLLIEVCDVDFINPQRVDIDRFLDIYERVV